GYVDLGYELLARGAKPDRRAARRLARKYERDEFVRLLGGEMLPAVDIPRSVRQVVERAEALYARQQHAEALKVYAGVPASFSSRIFANVANSAWCLQQLGRHAEAAPMFERALALDPSKAAQMCRGLCFSHYELAQWKPMLRAAKR